jgi:L-ribulose-5-phosphate 3-epimerase
VTTNSIGVCSWSLQPQDAHDLAVKVDACGLRAVQLALDPIRRGDMKVEELLAVFEPRGIRIMSGMMGMSGEDYSTLESIRHTGGIVPDATWKENQSAAVANARIAHELGLSLVTFHAGFVPHEAGRVRAAMIERLRRMADIFGERGVDIALETGQESAVILHSLVHELGDRRIGVNFDPANMILYGMGNPVEAVRVLGPFIRQVHIKDAVATTEAGTWGRETAAGSGDVDWAAFFAVLRESDVRCDFAIEREAGGTRIDDIRTAVELVEKLTAAAERA